MTTLTNIQLREIEGIFREFIWNGKSPKIALETLMLPKEQGGLRLVNMRAKQDTIKIAWVFKVDNNNLFANCAYKVIVPILRQTVWKCNISPQSVKQLFDTSEFWSQVLLSWSKIN